MRIWEHTNSNRTGSLTGATNSLLVQRRLLFPAFLPVMGGHTTLVYIRDWLLFFGFFFFFPVLFISFLVLRWRFWTGRLFLFSFSYTAPHLSITECSWSSKRISPFVIVQPKGDGLSPWLMIFCTGCRCVSVLESSFFSPSGLFFVVQLLRIYFQISNISPC